MSGLLSKDIAVLDVGSRLISAIVGTKKAQSVFGIKSAIEKEHQGFENGVWFDEDDTLRIAAEVLIDAMRAAGSRTKRLFISVPAEFVSVVAKEVIVKLDRRRRVIDEDIDYLLRKGDNFNNNKYLTINSSAIYYAIKDSDKLYTDVRGLETDSIDASVSYVLCERRFTQVFDAMAQKLGFNDVRYISTSWAECVSLLEKEQRDSVYTLIDIGYLSSSVAIARGEGILELKSFSLGSAHIAADLFEALDVPFELACEAVQLTDLNLNYPETSVLVSDGNYSIYASDACEAVKSRLDIFAEIIGDILRSIEDYAPAYMPIYLTGEGIASIRGAKKYLSEQLGKNIEILTPRLPGFIKPSDSSKASLLIVAESLPKIVLADVIKRLFNGGKK